MNKYVGDTESMRQKLNSNILKASSVIEVLLCRLDEFSLAEHELIHHLLQTGASAISLNEQKTPNRNFWAFIFIIQRSMFSKHHQAKAAIEDKPKNIHFVNQKWWIIHASYFAYIYNILFIHLSLLITHKYVNTTRLLMCKGLHFKVSGWWHFLTELTGHGAGAAAVHVELIWASLELWEQGKRK